MVIELSPDLEASLNEIARQQSIAPEELALRVLRERFLGPPTLMQPQDEWERRLVELAKPGGVSLPDWALGREALYE